MNIKYEQISPSSHSFPWNYKPSGESELCPSEEEFFSSEKNESLKDCGFLIKELKLN